MMMVKARVLPVSLDPAPRAPSCLRTPGAQGRNRRHRLRAMMPLILGGPGVQPECPSVMQW